MGYWPHSYLGEARETCSIGASLPHPAPPFQLLGPFSRSEDMTGKTVTIRVKFQLGLDLVAHGFTVGTARMETTPRGRIHRARNIAFKNHTFFFLTRIGNRHGGEQGLCIGVLGFLVNLVAFGDFDDLAQVHDRDAVTDMLNYPEVMGNEEVGEMHRLLEFLQEIDDLGLNGDIQ